ncbi:hypothetical protein TNCV_3209181 [Trichonephila clavipes]|nr:hypothetical protein TNCV_3209181 [Trichonephila clavipes]
MTRQPRVRYLDHWIAAATMCMGNGVIRKMIEIVLKDSQVIPVSSHPYLTELEDQRENVQGNTGLYISYLPKKSNFLRTSTQREKKAAIDEGSDDITVR